MNLESLSAIFNRALFHTFGKKKLLLVFSILFFSGLLVVFFRGLALHAGNWVQLSLTFLPIFLCSGILLSASIFIIRAYYHELKHEDIGYQEILSRSWHTMIGASYFTIPVILSYLLLWVMLGIFVLLGEIPQAGGFFSVILSFAPFVINLATLLLCLISLGILFFVAPLIALKKAEGIAVIQSTIKRLEKDPFSNCLLLFIGLIPLIVVVSLLTLAATMTGTTCLDCQTPLQTTLKWFFIMIPFTAFLTPPVVFFFNFAAETHGHERARPFSTQEARDKSHR